MDFPISVPSIGLVGGKFVDEDPLAGTPGSLIPAQWGNAVTQEVLNAIVGAGLVPDESNNAQLVMAIRLLQKQPVLVADTGVVNAYAAVNAPALTALPAKGYVQRIVIAHANTGPATYAPDGLAAKPIYGLGLQPLQGGELPVGVAVLMYLVQAGVNSGNGAWIIIESLGGASQVAAATQSAHAMQFGQATGRLIAVRKFDVVGASVYTPTPGTKSIIVEGVGGGGGSGGAASTSATQASAGQGGGSGTYGRSYYSSDFAGVTITIGAGGTAGPVSGTAGSGGTTSFGALLTLPGGVGGKSGSAVVPPAAAQSSSAAASPATGANISSVTGAPGSTGVIYGTSAGPGQSSGAGASNPLGAGGEAVSGGASIVGVPGYGYGSGASGPASPASSSTKIGVAGSSGALIIYEYS